MTAAPPRVALRWVVGGRVQGVYFRAFTKDRAQELGVQGWVRNLPDGRVECVAAGAPGVIARLRAALETGPPAARVTSVEESEWTGSEPNEGFEIRR